MYLGNMLTAGSSYTKLVMNRFETKIHRLKIKA
jgi:hypothetical protein